MNQSLHEQAVFKKREQDIALRAFHAEVCELLEGERRDELVKKAQERVDLWATRKLCSTYFIKHWASVLAANDTERFRSVVLDPKSKHSLGLMQNTPFSFLMSTAKE